MNPNPPPSGAAGAGVRPQTPHKAYLGLGANLGPSQACLMAALQSLKAHPAVLELRASGFYRSAPVQAQGPDFINAVALVHTRLGAYELLHVMQQLEHQAGRERPYPNAPRTLDLDLLLFDDVHQTDPALTLPHPRMWERAFVLLPLHELAPELVSPARLQAVADQRIERISSG